MAMLTINETAEKTGLSSYEIRRRVHTGQCPHIRVGAKATKILILIDDFIEQLRKEIHKNMLNNKPQDDKNGTDYSKIRKIG